MKKTKICSRCKIEKSLEEFTKKKSNKDGFDNECRECKSKRKKQWQEKNKNYVPPSREKITFICKECGKERTVNRENYPEDEVCLFCKRKETMKEKYGYETNLMKYFNLREIDISDGYRTCSKCGRNLPLEHFAKNRTKKCGISDICLDCNSERSKQWNERNPEKKKEKDKEYIHRNKEKIRERNKRDYLENREEKLQKAKQYYEENKEYIKERVKKYRQTDIGRAVKILSSAKRRAREKYTDIDADFLKQLKEETEYCELCGEKIEYPELDHIIPLNIGGPNIKSNVRYICSDCNGRRPRDGRDVLGDDIQ